MMRSKIIIAILTIIILTSLGCGKGFLEVKPDKAQVVPERIEDFQALLDNTNIAFTASGGLAGIASDEYFRFDSDMPVLLGVENNTYTWEKDMYAGWRDIWDWNQRYESIFYANIALEGLEKIRPVAEQQLAWNIAKGTAMFYRAINVYQLAEYFCQPYDKATASSMPGVPLRTSADVNGIVQRGTLDKVYEFVIRELAAAETLLPDRGLNLYRPGRAAVFAMLSRVCLSMQDYANAEKYAEACLRLQRTLIDYNTVDRVTEQPFESPLTDPSRNPEIILFGTASGFSFNVDRDTYVDTAFYNTYADNDLRKSIFFHPRKGYHFFKGGYDGGRSRHGGPCTDEMYLIKAECLARAGNVAAAMDTLNVLLVKRYDKSSFVPQTATDAEDALRKVLTERKKELIGRCIRWLDLRRLNRDPRFAVTLQRLRNGKLVTLSPGDQRYTFPIPEQETENSGIEQNPR